MDSDVWRSETRPTYFRIIHTLSLFVTHYDGGDEHHGLANYCLIVYRNSTRLESGFDLDELTTNYEDVMANNDSSFDKKFHGRSASKYYSH